METSTFFRISSLYGVILVLLGANKVDTGEVVWLAIVTNMDDLRKVLTDNCEMDSAVRDELLADAKKAGLPPTNPETASAILTGPLSQAFMVGYHVLLEGGGGTNPEEIAAQAREEAAADGAAAGAKERAEQAVANGDATGVEMAVEEGPTADPLHVGLLFAPGARRGTA